QCLGRGSHVLPDQAIRSDRRFGELPRTYDEPAQAPRIDLRRRSERQAAPKELQDRSNLGAKLNRAYLPLPAAHRSLTISRRTREAAKFDCIALQSPRGEHRLADDFRQIAVCLPNRAM